MKALIWKELREYRMFFWTVLSLMVLTRIGQEIIPKIIYDTKMAELWGFFLGFFIFPVLSAFAGAIAFNSEFIQGTRQFLLNRPMAPWKIFFIKCLAGVCVMIPLSAASYYMFYVPSHRMSILLGIDMELIPHVTIYIFLIYSTGVYFSFLLGSLIFKNTIVSIMFSPLVVFLDFILCLPAIVVFFYFGIDSFNCFLVLSLSLMLVVLVVFSYVIWDYSVVRESRAVKAVLATLAVMLIVFYSIHGVFTVISHAGLKKALETAQKEGISLSFKEAYSTGGNIALDGIIKLAEDIDKKYSDNINEFVTYDNTWRDGVDEKKKEGFLRLVTEDKEVLEFFRKCNEFVKTEASKTFVINRWYWIDKIFKFNDLILRENKNYTGVLNNTLCYMKIRRILQERYGDRYTYYANNLHRILISAINSVPSEKSYEKALAQILEEHVGDELTEKKVINESSMWYAFYFRIGTGTAKEHDCYSLPDKLVFNLYRSYVCAPLFNRDTAYFINFYAEKLNLCKIPYYKLERKYIDIDYDKGDRKDVYRDYIIAFMGRAIPHVVMNRYIGFTGSQILRSYNQTKAIEGCLTLSLALKLYKAKHGEYPENIEKLCPEFIGKLPQDPFSGENFMYERKDNGFSVYSAGDKSIGGDIGITCEL